jgi:CubicO group peptidase (beta-lactamase class C family)
MKTTIAPAALCLVLVLSLFGYGQDWVRDDGISTPLHRAHLGLVTFMAKPIPIQEYRERDFLKVYQLRETGDLNIGVFLKSSLMNELHRLAPKLGPEELNRIGNYQFSFFVDGAMVYRENLPWGAGAIGSKISRTVFRVPLMSTTEEDSWGRFLWYRFLMNGGLDALTAGRHDLKIEIRPYVLAPGLKTGDLMASGQIVLDVVKPEIDEAKTAPQPIRPGSGWPVSDGPYDTARIRELKRRIAQRDFKDITSLVVIRDGKLLIEEYFGGADRTTMHNTRSVGKTFASALMGLAVRDGHIKGLDGTLGELYDLGSFAHPSSKKAGVSLRHLLTMSSAFAGSDQDGDSPGTEEKMHQTPDWVKFALDLPMDEAKANGAQWDYFTAGVILIGDILDKAVPGGLEQFAARELFTPLGIERYEWQYTPQKVVNTGGGLQMAALDYAKFGQLYKNGGLWNGKPVLPRTWVEATLTKHIKIPNRENESYGLLFWHKTYRVQGKPCETFYAAGNGGSKIYVFTGQPLVVVITATAYNTPYGHPQVDKMMTDYILPAVLR